MTSIGIAPRNGWIADYPVTPDIFGELQRSVGDAADAGKLGMSKNEALKRLSDVNMEIGPAHERPLFCRRGPEDRLRPPALSVFPLRQAVLIHLFLRQGKFENRTFSCWLGLDPDPASVPLGDLLARSEPYTCSGIGVFVGAIEDLEDAVRLFTNPRGSGA